MEVEVEEMVMEERYSRKSAYLNSRLGEEVDDVEEVTELRAFLTVC